PPRVLLLLVLGAEGSVCPLTCCLCLGADLPVVCTVPCCWPLPPRGDADLLRLTEPNPLVPALPPGLVTLPLFPLVCRPLVCCDDPPVCCPFCCLVLL